MSTQQNFKYFINNKEVDNRTDYLNITMSGEFITFLEGNSVFSFPLSDFLDGERYQSKREINEHLKELIFKDCEKPQQNSSLNSTRHKAREDNKFHVEKENKTMEYLDEILERIEKASEINQKSQDYIDYWKSKKQENLVFPKDSEIHKEELPPHKELDFSLLLSDWVDRMSWTKDRPVTFTVSEGVKDSNGKTDYSEIDWTFIEGLAKRMNKNKEKYEPFNYHKPMDVNLLKQSLLRHVIEILKGEYNDAGQEYGHFFATALNSMMIYYQLKNNPK